MTSFSLLVEIQIFLVFIVSTTIGLEINNGIVGVPKVECHEDVLSLDVETRKPFTGNIFVKGKAADPACMRKFNRNTGSFAAYTMQLGRCGMQRLRSANPRGMSFVLTVIVSFHPHFITKVDRAYHIRCFYMEPDEVVSQKLEVSMIPTTVLSHSMTMPTCHYTVRRDSPNGPLVNFANVGDRVFHVWECTGKDMGMMVKKCFVTGGQSKEQTVVEYDGCTTDEILLSELVYDKTLMKAHAESHVFKFADVNQLYFTCQIRLCQKQMGLCQGITPPTCSSLTRRRRRRRSAMDLVVLTEESKRMRQASAAELTDSELPTIDVAANDLIVVDVGAGVDSKDMEQTPRSPRNGRREQLFPSHFAKGMLAEKEDGRWRRAPSAAVNDGRLCLSALGVALLFFSALSLAVIASTVALLVYRKRGKAITDRFLQPSNSPPPPSVKQFAF